MTAHPDSAHVVAPAVATLAVLDGAVVTVVSLGVVA